MSRGSGVFVAVVRVSAFTAFGISPAFAAPTKVAARFGINEKPIELFAGAGDSLVSHDCLSARGCEALQKGTKASVREIAKKNPNAFEGGATDGGRLCLYLNGRILWGAPEHGGSHVALCRFPDQSVIACDSLERFALKTTTATRDEGLGLRLDSLARNRRRLKIKGGSLLMKWMHTRSWPALTLHFAAVLAAFVFSFGLFNGVAANAKAVVADTFGKVASFSGTEAGMEVGDLYYSVNLSGIRMSILRIKSLSAEGGEAFVLKGTPSPGEILIKRSGAPAKRKTAPSGGDANAGAGADNGGSGGDPEAETRSETRSDGDEPSQQSDLGKGGKSRRRGARRKRNADDGDVGPGMGFRVGVGVTYFTLKGTSLNSGVGFGGAFLIDFPVKRIDITSGLEIYQAGAQYSVDTINEKITLTYAGLPVQVRYDFLNAEDSAFRVKGGLMFAYRVASSLTLTGPISASSSDNSGDKLDTAVTLGVNYAYKVAGKDSYWFDLDYYNGVRTFNGNVTNNGWIVMFGMGF